MAWCVDPPLLILVCGASSAGVIGHFSWVEKKPEGLGFSTAVRGKGGSLEINADKIGATGSKNIFFVGPPSVC